MLKTPLINLPHKESIKISYGLSWLKGNRAPYFSVTADLYEKRANGRAVHIGGGCCHKDILKARPGMADIVALHLCDIDGAPMHDLENGFYHMGGFKDAPPKFERAASHFRISQDEARELAKILFGDSFSIHAGFLSKDAAIEGKALLGAWIDSQRPRWAREARDVIEKYQLPIPADPNKAVA